MADAIQNVSHTHEQIINWLLENPEKALRECAEYFHYTQGWLSQIIHSDCFQAQLRMRQNDVFVRCAQDIPVKLKGLADVAIEKVQDALERSADGDFALDVFDKTLHRLGYAPNTSRSVALQPGALVQQNNFFLGKEDLKGMRQGMLPAPGGITEAEIVTMLPAADLAFCGNGLEHPTVGLEMQSVLPAAG